MSAAEHVVTSLVRPVALRPGVEYIHTSGLSVGFEGHPVCSSVDLKVGPGEALFVVGANGAGKSTLLRTCLGLQPAISGSSLVMGEVADPRSSLQRSCVARDLGDEAFFPSLSVREHLELVSYGHGVKNARSIVESVMEEMGLLAVADSVPDRLSSGQRRRLSLSSVLVRPRSILVLDEPEQRLDAATRKALAGYLNAEREAGGALLVVSHDPVLVEASASAVLVVGSETMIYDVGAGVLALKEGT
ncbi:ABC transporter ATP-binding protein [Actinomyces wuliandei]|nr:ATP-binding cassette domain-containing protein [Actinomyces wuliandei]